MNTTKLTVPPFPIKDPFAGMIHDGYLHEARNLKTPIAARTSDVHLGENLIRGVTAGVVAKGPRPGKHKGELGGEGTERLLDGYVSLFGTDRAGGFRRKALADCPRRLNHRTGQSFPDRLYLTWRSLKRRCTRADVAKLLDGESRITLDRRASFKEIALDFDAHGPPDREWLKANAPGTSNSPSGRYWLVRRWRDHLLRSCAMAAQETMMNLAFVETTEGGIHVTVVMSERMPAEEAARRADEWKRAVVAKLGGRLPAGVKLESFPRRDGAKWMGLSLPLGRTQRLVDADDLYRLKHASRVDDARYIVDVAPKPHPDRVAAILECMDKVPAVTRRRRGRDGVVVVEETLGGEGRGPQLFKSEFASYVENLLVRGVENDDSWNAVSKLVAACRYVGRTCAETLRAVRRFLYAGGHRATRTATHVGLKRLMGTARACLRHFQEGLKDGTCWVGGMRSLEVDALTFELANVPS